MMLEETKYEKMFSTPVLRFHFPEHPDLNEALLKEGAALRAKSEGVAKSNRGGWHSDGNLFENQAAPIKILRVMAEECVLAGMKKIGAKANLDQLTLKLFAWMNANPSMGYNAPHTHPGAHWSGVYYVSQPEVEEGNSGMIEFLNPRTDLPSWRILDAPPFRTKRKFRPRPGDMILFPSYLVHWVYPNETDEERVTIAFNATFRKSK
ncbi:TIGR02466 family protein [uncultured Ruegeria sp.]|uniref:TIGR02466 family protein n=1 Tax=uncultured Ruegeria sp. TaxID=259304 RepID=UPI002616AA02|nr:TIGR02466 family protein [uncultured Ruegeria sp.]